MTNEALQLGLDFANTSEWHAGPNPEERLTSYRVAVDWARGAGVVTDDQAARLVTRAERHPDEAGAALERAIALREAVYRVFVASSQDRHPDSRDLETLNAALQEGLPHLQLVAVPGNSTEAAAAGTTREGSSSENGQRFVWSWVDLESELIGFLWPVARAVATLLTSAQLGRVRMCADDTCGWLFIDQSKNASRRWCDMGDCGNRAKARRYRARQKADQPQ